MPLSPLPPAFPSSFGAVVRHERGLGLGESHHHPSRLNLRYPSQWGLHPFSSYEGEEIGLAWSSFFLEFKLVV